MYLMYQIWNSSSGLRVEHGMQMRLGNVIITREALTFLVVQRRTRCTLPCESSERLSTCSRSFQDIESIRYLRQPWVASIETHITLSRDSRKFNTLTEAPFFSNSISTNSKELDETHCKRMASPRSVSRLSKHRRTSRLEVFGQTISLVSANVIWSTHHCVHLAPTRMFDTQVLRTRSKIPFRRESDAPNCVTSNCEDASPRIQHKRCTFYWIVLLSKVLSVWSDNKMKQGTHRECSKLKGIPATRYTAVVKAFKAETRFTDRCFSQLKRTSTRSIWNTIQSRHE